jgi:hypothetical protein
VDMEETICIIFDLFKNYCSWQWVCHWGLMTETDGTMMWSSGVSMTCMQQHN